MDITWRGRMYVDEKEITPEQYKMFFARTEYGIPFRVANTILRMRQEGFMEECVPCDELHHDATELIKKEIRRSADLNGQIEYQGQHLKWAWTPHITGTLDDENEDYEEDINYYDLPKWAREKILYDMLDFGSHWGAFWD